MDAIALVTASAAMLAAIALAARFGHRRGRSGRGLLRDGITASDAGRASELYALASQLLDFYNATAHPADLRSSKGFRRAVALLRSPAFEGTDLLGYFAGDNAVIACVAGEALRERGDTNGLEERLFGAVGSVAPWPLFFALEYLAQVVPPERSIAGRTLVRTLDHLDYRLSRQFLQDFIRERSRRGEVPTFADEPSQLNAEQLGALTGFLRSLDPELGTPLLDQLDRWQRQHIDTEFLSTIGSLFEARDAVDGGVLWHEAMRDQVSALESALTAEQPRSALLVGESGVGKSKVARAVAGRLQRDGWLVFEAGATELVAGQLFLGQFEERFQRLLAQLRGQRILWLIRDFHALAESGTHRFSTTSALDLLLPHAESGEIVLVGECQPGPFEKLVLAKPRIATALTVHRIAPLQKEATLELAGRWWETHAEEDGRDSVLAEAQDLAQQYLGDRAAPGNLLRMLEITWQRLVGLESARKTKICVDDLIVTLTGVTGLPAQILDDRRRLDLESLRQHFAARVIGQPEAVDCLVERVAMVKAGLADPTRPFGVFLFAGPTGTGKTEIAKALAEYLFGSPDRMLRIDMSELQSPEDLDRLVGGSEPSGNALVDRIREQPFSVILLDEFEKGHPRSWDLFLQVFDDGRLTDRRGRVADFRYSIVILTSNLGAMESSGDRLGFATERDAFRSRDVLHVIDEAFRPEFRNRLDRVVVFRPLDRETMRSILRGNLDEVMQRRGLRARPWAVEWDPAAIEFLLTEGFSSRLGARPLKRAVERHLLAPLAQTIVRREFPTGDQFLYVTLADGALAVQFIDPDAPRESPASESVAELDDEEESGGGLAAIVRDPRGVTEELERLEACFERMEASVASDVWLEKKQTVLGLTELPDFWRSPDRFEILGQYEYQERIEAAMRRTRSLLARLRRRQRDQLPRELIASVAQTLLLLDIARADVEEGRPQAAFVLVEGGRDAGLRHEASDHFAARIGTMYLGWAANRHMLVETLSRREGAEESSFRLLLSVSGFGSHSILADEAGLHVLETPAEGGRGFDRCRAQVGVIPQEGDPGDGSAKALRLVADSAFASLGPLEPRVVRRYRTAPSPLVRDGVRGWRTGKIDLVLGGNFDLLGQRAP